MITYNDLYGKDTHLQELNIQNVESDQIPETNIRPFDNEITNVEQFKNGLEYIVNQIGEITKLIKWITFRQSVQAVLKESIDPYDKASEKIIQHSNNVNLVKQRFDNFFTNEYIVDSTNNRRTLDEQSCNNLRNLVNEETEDVNTIIHRYKKKNQEMGVTYPKPLSTSCEIFNNSVKVFNDAVKRYGQNMGFEIVGAEIVNYDNVK